MQMNHDTPITAASTVFFFVVYGTVEFQQRGLAHGHLFVELFPVFEIAPGMEMLLLGDLHQHPGHHVGFPPLYYAYFIYMDV